MISKEIIKRCINFGKPERIGLNFCGNRINDISHVVFDVKSKRSWIEGEKEFSLDEWGNIWHRMIGKEGGATVMKSAIGEWDDADSYQIPDIANPNRYKTMKQIFTNNQEKYNLAHVPAWPFSIMRKLRPFEEFLVDFSLHKDKVEYFSKRLVEVIGKCIEIEADAGADGIFFTEDWGDQDRLFINPIVWREVVKPRYIDLVNIAKTRNLTVWMHSCGYIYNIINDLIDIGIDVLQFDQPALIGIDKLGNEFGRKIAFWCPVDIQKTLPTGNRTLIENEAKKLIDSLGKFNGGFIAKAYGDTWEDVEVLQDFP